MVKEYLIFLLLFCNILFSKSYKIDITDKTYSNDEISDYDWSVDYKWLYVALNKNIFVIGPFDFDNYDSTYITIKNLNLKKHPGFLKYHKIKISPDLKKIFIIYSWDKNYKYNEYDPHNCYSIIPIRSFVLYKSNFKLINLSDLTKEIDYIEINNFPKFNNFNYLLKWDDTSNNLLLYKDYFNLYIYSFKNFESYKLPGLPIISYKNFKNKIEKDYSFSTSLYKSFEFENVELIFENDHIIITTHGPSALELYKAPFLGKLTYKYIKNPFFKKSWSLLKQFPNWKEIQYISREKNNYTATVNIINQKIEIKKDIGWGNIKKIIENKRYLIIKKVDKYSQ